MSSDYSKTSTTVSKAAVKSSGCGGGGTGAAAGLRLPEQGLNCPRCDSPNTKFCYYNNYSLTQPRHFCKSCRRYWTKGGALRTVPVGGGCRKNRKSKPSSSSSTSLPAINQTTTTAAGGMEFQLGSFLPYSIESLSSINQDLHWKLQQQRMQMMFVEQQGGSQSVVSFAENNQVGPSGCVDVAGKVKYNGGGGGHEVFVGESSSGQGNVAHNEPAGASTAWFLDGHFAVPSSASSAAVNDVSAAVDNGNGVTDWNGMAAAWSDVHRFNTLP